MNGYGGMGQQLFETLWISESIAENGLHSLLHEALEGICESMANKNWVLQVQFYFERSIEVSWLMGNS